MIRITVPAQPSHAPRACSWRQKWTKRPLLWQSRCMICGQRRMSTNVHLQVYSLVYSAFHGFTRLISIVHGMHAFDCRKNVHPQPRLPYFHLWFGMPMYIYVADHLFWAMPEALSFFSLHSLALTACSARHETCKAHQCVTTVMLVDKAHFPTRHEIKAGTRKNRESRSHDMTKHQTSNTNMPCTMNANKT